MKMKFCKAALVLIAAVMCATFCSAQETASTAKKKAGKKGAALSSKSPGGWEKTWYIKARLFTTFDSNFDKEPVAVRSFGAIPSVDLGFQLQKDRHRLQFQYSAGYPRYTNFAEYNRPGQYFRVSYRNSSGRRWSSETEFETRLKGIDEDRELNNQFVLTQKFNYRPTKKDKIGLYGVYRLKRQSADPNQDASNPQAGIKYTRQITGKIEAYGGFRYDRNIARGLRQRYLRRTFSVGADIEPTRRDRINFEARYAPRLYGRLVEVNGADVPRSDKKWTYDVSWQHAITARFGFEAGYQFETRNSNDPDKLYKNHQVVFAFYYRWGNGDDR